jgi:hypothetical protein
MPGGTVQRTVGMPPFRAASFWLILIVVLVIGGLHTAAQIKRGWVPHDEGTIAQTAERVLHGELPHRDFDDRYTGGLSLLNAAAFRLLGTTLLSPRIVLVTFFMLTIPAMYWAATRFLSPLAAGAVTLIAVAWSVPNYVAALPSWYNLFFSVFGLAALLRYVETAHARWTFAAGLCAAFSLLIKIVALYYVGAVGLFLLYREQADDARSLVRKPSRTYSILLSALLGALVLAVVATIRRRFDAVDVGYFILPGIALPALLVAREWAEPRGPAGPRLARVGRMALPFLAGFTLPLAIYCVPYARAGALHGWFTGAFLLPWRRMDFSEINTMHVGDALAAVVSGEIIGIAAIAGQRMRWWHVAFIGATLSVVLRATSQHIAVYRVTWYSAAMLIPFTVTAATLLLWRRGHRLEKRGEQIALLVAVVGLCNLIQFPFSAPIYFCYVAPLLILLIVSLLGIVGVPSYAMLGVLGAFYAAFAVFRTTPGFINVLGQIYVPDVQTHRLDLPRSGGLLVDATDANAYPELVRIVHQRAGGPLIWAGPDCPEVYFLSGMPNPTRTLFDFLDDPDERPRRLHALFAASQLKLVVINTDPKFSGLLEPELRADLVARFPNLRTVGPFEVRWRE